MANIKRRRDVVDTTTVDSTDSHLRKRPKTTATSTSSSANDILPPHSNAADNDDLHADNEVVFAEAAIADDDDATSDDEDNVVSDDEEDADAASDDDDEEDAASDDDDEDEDDSDVDDDDIAPESDDSEEFLLSSKPSKSRSKSSGSSRSKAASGDIWRKKDDDALMQAVNAYDAAHKSGKAERNWSAIAQHVRNKTDQQCSQRWDKVVNPKLVKGPWTAEEDETLRKLVKQYGPRQWTKIASLMRGRVGKQCNERWHNHLAPELRKGPFTPEEDQILIQKQAEFGNKWAIIATFLPGRAQNTIKNRWNATLKRRKPGKPAASAVVLPKLAVAAVAKNRNARSTASKSRNASPRSAVAAASTAAVAIDAASPAKRSPRTKKAQAIKTPRQHSTELSAVPQAASASTPTKTAAELVQPVDSHAGDLGCLMTPISHTENVQNVFVLDEALDIANLPDTFFDQDFSEFSYDDIEEFTHAWHEPVATNGQTMA